MLFTQIEFFYYFIVVLLGCLCIGASRRRNLFLLIASYYFYAYWDWRFLGLIIGCTAANYFLASLIDSAPSGYWKRCYLISALVVSLGCLGFFKYFNFFLDSLSIFTNLTVTGTMTLKIILPVGISFYTFQALSYTIDVYQGRIEVNDSYLDFSLFVAFFPQLVAGPIVKARELLPQIQNPSGITTERIVNGLKQFVVGFFKKVFIADRLSMFVDYVFENYPLLDGSTIWLAVIAFALQIYCDFSGYSDMAIGIARSLGYDFNPNFNYPYLAKNISDFWRRWHISLSTWFRDYLYIPLGGNRKSLFRTYFNLFLTMLIAGLWHGASWTFVFWGGIHGLALIVHRIAKKFFFAVPIRVPSTVNLLSSWALTSLFVCLAWIFFRAESFVKGWEILKGLFVFGSGVEWYPPIVILCIIIMISYHAIYAFRPAFVKNILDSPIWATTIYTTLFLLPVCFYPAEFQPFIYFQF